MISQQALWIDQTAAGSLYFLFDLVDTGLSLTTDCLPPLYNSTRFWEDNMGTLHKTGGQIWPHETSFG